MHYPKRTQYVYLTSKAFYQHCHLKFEALNMTLCLGDASRGRMGIWAESQSVNLVLHFHSKIHSPINAFLHNSCFTPSHVHSASLTTIDSRNMVSHETLELIGSVVESVAIIWRLSTAQLISVLPVEVRWNGRRVECRVLPGLLNGTMVRGHSILLEHARLSSSLACCPVRGDPAVAPVVRGSP